MTWHGIPPAERLSCLDGLRAERALEEIVRRKTERAARKPSSSGRRTALVLQGGGMRGVVSAGAMIPMATYGFTEGFDAVYGSSAGALNGAYFLGDQAAFGASIYYRDVANRRFIDFLRPHKIMDLDFVFDEVVGKDSPVDVQRVLRNRTPLKIISTIVETGEPAVHTSHDGIDLLEVLKASCAVPGLYGRSFEVAGCRLVDGGIVSPLPIRQALEDGCTDLLVVFTIPKKSPRSGGFDGGRSRAPGFGRASGLVRTIRRSRSALDDALSLVSGARRSDVLAGINIVAVFPHPAVRIHWCTKGARRLTSAASDMASRMMRLFAQYSDHEAHEIELVRLPESRPATTRPRISRDQSEG